MEMQQMLERILAGQEEMKAKMKAEREAWREEMKAEMEAWREEMRADREQWKAKMDKRMTKNQARTDGKLKELTETMEKTQTEPREEMMQSAEEHHEVPNKDAVVIPVRIRKRRHRGRKEAAGRRLEPKELNRGDQGSRKKLAPACRKASHRATVAWIKRNVFRKSWTCGFYGLRKEVTASRKEVTRYERHRQKVAQRSPTGGAFEHRCRRGPQCGMGRKDPTLIDIRGWSSGQLSPLGRGGPTYKILKMALELEFVKRAPGISIGLRQMRNWTLWRGRPPPKRKKEPRTEQETVM
jgi:hypothetical protein